MTEGRDFSQLNVILLFTFLQAKTHYTRTTIYTVYKIDKKTRTYCVAQETYSLSCNDLCRKELEMNICIYN